MEAMTAPSVCNDQEFFVPTNLPTSVHVPDPYGNTFLSPSLTNREPLAQRQAQHRSQTAPMTVPSHTSPDRPPRLRRNTTTSARMHALERAYTIVANDASQIPVEGLVQATGLVNRIHTALNEQIARKLAKGESKAGGEF